MKNRLLLAFLVAVALPVARPSAGRQAAPSTEKQREIAQAERQAEHDVPRLVEALELQPGMAVADIGAGYGAMSVVLARWLGPAGRVYATDIDPERLSDIQDAVARGHVDNV